VLDHGHASVGELLDVGNVVVLSDVNTADSSHHEREATFDYTHLIEAKLRGLGMN